MSSGGNIITNGSNATPFRLLSIVSGIAACILCGLYEAVVRGVGFRSMAKSDNVQLFRITKSPISLFFHTSRSVSVLAVCSLSNIKQCHNQPELNSARNRRCIAHKCRKCIEIDSHVSLLYTSALVSNGSSGEIELITNGQTRSLYPKVQFHTHHLDHS